MAQEQKESHPALSGDLQNQGDGLDQNMHHIAIKNKEYERSEAGSNCNGGQPKEQPEPPKLAHETNEAFKLPLLTPLSRRSSLLSGGPEETSAIAYPIPLATETNVAYPAPPGGPSENNKRNEDEQFRSLSPPSISEYDTHEIYPIPEDLLVQKAPVEVEEAEEQKQVVSELLAKLIQERAALLQSLDKQQNNIAKLDKQLQEYGEKIAASKQLTIQYKSRIASLKTTTERLKKDISAELNRKLKSLDNTMQNLENLIQILQQGGKVQKELAAVIKEYRLDIRLGTEYPGTICLNEQINSLRAQEIKEENFPQLQESLNDAQTKLKAQQTELEIYNKEIQNIIFLKRQIDDIRKQLENLHEEKQKEATAAADIVIPNRALNQQHISAYDLAIAKVLKATHIYAKHTPWQANLTVITLLLMAIYFDPKSEHKGSFIPLILSTIVISYFSIFAYNQEKEIVPAAPSEAGLYSAKNRHPALENAVSDPIQERKNTF
jgi:hypothetical protein